MKIQNNTKVGYHLGGLVFPAGLSVPVNKEQVEHLKTIDAFTNATEAKSLEIKGQRKPKKVREEE